MNYPQSQEILEEIKKAKKILLACHKGVDPDSIVSNILLKHVIENFGKKVDLVLADVIPDYYKTLDKKGEIKENIDFTKFAFSKYDLFITCDINDWKRINLEDPEILGKMHVVNIDHHEGQYINALTISDVSYSSTTEMIFYLLEDWKIEITKDMANLVLAGIISDTDSFNYGATPRVFRCVSKLMELGADYDEVSVWLLRNNSELQLKFWSKILTNLNVDHEHKFAYTFMSAKDFKKFKGVIHPARTTADMFLRTISGINFGIVMLEEVKGELKVSVRDRSKDFGVLELCRQLGGGGHFTGGGGMIKGLPFDKAVEKVLETAKKYAKENS